MWIDLLFLLCMVWAVFRGLRQGFLVVLFSVIALIIGLAAAMKFSAAVAAWMETHMHLPSRWLPFMAFLLVFIGFAMLVRWGARLGEAALDLAMMGWLNRIAGILLYAVLYTIVLSVLLFYAVQVHVVPEHTLTSSVTYPWIRPWGPAVIGEIAKFVPFFKGMFTQLEEFFGKLRDSPPSL